jgi:hypothetical protein
MMGEGIIKNELYILKSQQRLCVLIKKKQDRDLLHKRLGHLLDKVLSNFFNFPIRNCISCDIYKLVKQIRLPFSLSNSKSNDLFYLIHFDVRGPTSLFFIMVLSFLSFLLIFF